jgi:predicted O-methyltransferase YrrM
MSRATEAPAPGAGEITRTLLSQAYGTRADRAQGSFITQGMQPPELVRLYETVRSSGARAALEIGMACGTSSLVIARAVSDNGGGTLTSIDPFQTSSFDRAGVQHVAAAGFGAMHRLIEQPDYLALPALLAAASRFDFIFIDGWHSFDFALVDLFYADLLLDPGGVVALHDTSWPAVYKAVRFFESHKPYERLSPAPMIELGPLAKRVGRRLAIACAGSRARRDARARRLQWHSLSAYRKLAAAQTPQRVVHPF